MICERLVDMGLPIYCPAKVVNVSNNTLPTDKRLPKGWSAIRLDDLEHGLQLKWSDAMRSTMLPLEGNVRFRITVALDYRASNYVDIYLLNSGVLLGRIDIRYAYTFQPFEIILTAQQAESILAEGVRLQVSGRDAQLWIFDELNGDTSRALFSPHLLIGESDHRLDSFIDHMVSLSSLQPFGWLEGCVLDGLFALRSTIGSERVDPVIEAHLNQFVDDAGQLLYEDLYGRPADGNFTTIEATLPLATIVKINEDHPVLEQAVTYWDVLRSSNEGAVINKKTVTAEGTYTVAYPLASIAKRLNRKDLAEQAVHQVLLRRDWLARDRHVYLRYHQDTRSHSFQNWARAFAWYSLGMIRTWIELKESDYAELYGLDEIEKEIVRMAEVVISWRLAEGLWSNFLDHPDIEVDTSGSAGIATALALGSRYGLLPQKYLNEAETSFNALAMYLTPDGILSGVAQHNAGGIELQRSNYRVLSQMGSGLMAQLYAAVK